MKEAVTYAGRDESGDALWETDHAHLAEGKFLPLGVMKLYAGARLITATPYFGGPTDIKFTVPPGFDATTLTHVLYVCPTGTAWRHLP